METDIQLNTITPLLSNDTVKVVIDEITQLLSRIGKSHNLNVDNLKSEFNDDILKISSKLGLKRRNRRILPADKMCMGRKLDGKQCTRGRYKEGSDYCKSHANKLPLGRIDDELIINDNDCTGKKKIKKKSDAYVLTHIETIDDQNYLVDDKNFVYSFDVNNPEFLGIKVNNQIKKVENIINLSSSSQGQTINVC